MKSVFLDLETTGTRPVEKYGVWQIAGIVCDENLTELESFDFKCAPHPGDMVSPSALEVTRMTMEQLRALPPPRDIHTKLTEVLGRHCDKFNKLDKLWLYAFNASFDADHLRAWFDKCGDQYFGSWFWVPAIDIMTLAGEAMRRDRKMMPNFKLGTVCEALEIGLTNAHDALADVRAAKAVYERVTRRTEAA